MIAHYEAWSTLQSTAAMHALQAHARQERDHALVSANTPAIVWRRIQDGEVRAAFVGTGFFLVYDIGPTWCSDAPLFYELMLKRALPGGTFTEAVTDMKALARESGCAGLFTGNGVLRPGLRRLYEREGFRIFNEAYFMEV